MVLTRIYFACKQTLHICATSDDADNSLDIGILDSFTQYCDKPVYSEEVWLFNKSWLAFHSWGHRSGFRSSSSDDRHVEDDTWQRL